MSAYRLGVLAGLSPTYIRRLERGEVRALGLPALYQLARALDADPIDLLDDARGSMRPHVPDALSAVYAELGHASRVALLEHACTLKRLQDQLQGTCDDETTAENGSVASGTDAEKLKGPP